MASASTSAGNPPPPPASPPGLAGFAAPPAPTAATAPASVGFAAAASDIAARSSVWSSGGNPPAPACKTLKKTAAVSTASFGAPGDSSAPVALMRRNRTQVPTNCAPDAAHLSCSHFSRLRYSRLAASAASSTANAWGARSKTADSALRSWHTSSMRGTCAAPSLACVSAIALATHSCPC